MKKKILITGGMGFIGKFLTRKLLERTNSDIVIVDNLAASMADMDIINNPRVTFFQNDLSVWQVPNGDKYYQIYHLAAPVGPVKVLEYAGRIAGIIISHLEKMADLAITMDAKLMFISTSELYGKHSEGRTPEHVDKTVPDKITVRLEYGVGKLMGEIVLKNLSTAKPLKYNAIRPFNIVGPQQNAESGFVIPRFLQKALVGEDITVYGDGKMIRTFTHVDDFTDALIAIMDSDISGEIFNVGHPDNSISIFELAEKIKKATNSSSKITLVDPKVLFGNTFEEAWDKVPDVSKVKRLINWEPKWTLDQIIEQAAQDKNKFLVDKTEGVKFVITVDTEADYQKSGEDPLNINNFFYLPRFQTLCEKYNFIPTYLITQEIVDNPRATELLRQWQAEGKAEIGAHLHPWTTPPLSEKDKYMRYPSELSDEELKAKLIHLTDSITNNIGKKPLSYRAGRWGFDLRQAHILSDLGYIVDCSVTPKISWANMKGDPEKFGGPDFSREQIKPYMIDKTSILEVPMTIVYTGLVTSDDNWLGKFFNRLKDGLIKNILNKLFFQKKWLRIFPNSVESHWSKIYKAVQNNHIDVLEFMIHSSELALGASRQTKTDDQVEFTFAQLDQLFAFLVNKNVKGASLSDFAVRYKSKIK